MARPPVCTKTDRLTSQASPQARQVMPRALRHRSPIETRSRHGAPAGYRWRHPGRPRAGTAEGAAAAFEIDRGEAAVTGYQDRFLTGLDAVVTTTTDIRKAGHSPGHVVLEPSFLPCPSKRPVWRY